MMRARKLNLFQFGNIRLNLSNTYIIRFLIMVRSGTWQNTLCWVLYSVLHTPAKDEEMQVQKLLVECPHNISNGLLGVVSRRLLESHENTFSFSGHTC